MNVGGRYHCRACDGFHGYQEDCLIPSYLCNHANEVPATCCCPVNCYCCAPGNTCAIRGIHMNRNIIYGPPEPSFPPPSQQDTAPTAEYGLDLCAALQAIVATLKPLTKQQADRVVEAARLLLGHRQ